MGERFNRTSWDKYGGTTTTYNNEEARRGGTDQSLATKRIADALSEGKEFVLPGEIVNKRGVSLRIADLTGDFARIVRDVIEKQAEDKERRKLEEVIGFIQGEIEETGEYAFLLSQDNFYLTRLPYEKALGIFMTSIKATYFRELLRRYPENPKKRAELAGISEEELKQEAQGLDLSADPLPVNYDLSPLNDASLPTLKGIIEDDSAMFSLAYINCLEKRTNSNMAEMVKLSGMEESALRKLLTEFCV